MRHIGTIGLMLIMFWATGSFLIVMAGPQCPEGQWYNPELKKCVVPGEGDPNVDRNFRRHLKAECQFPCGDGWCCPNDYSCAGCNKLDGEEKARCYRKHQCWQRR